MIKGMVQFPGMGCIVEFMQGNEPNIAWVQEEQNGKLRLLLPNRREMTLQSNRLLPWAGPAHTGVTGRDAAVDLLLKHRETRERRAASLDMTELWAMAQGEVSKASASWFAELAQSEPDVDTAAAYGRALLACKTHFKFQPPDFEIFPENVVTARLTEQEAARVREELARQGSAWLAVLWEVHTKKRQARPQEALSPEVADQLRNLLLRRIADPESGEDEAQWRLLTKGMPDDPLLPLYLAEAWGLVSPHYNFWLDRADYAFGNTWALEHAVATECLEHNAAHSELPCREENSLVSVDSATTQDIDDAFHVTPLPEGCWDVELALACPAFDWSFGSALDKAVMHRATSLYLPEGNSHMLPEQLGVNAYALMAGVSRPALVVRCRVAGDGAILSCEPSLERVRVSANLTYESVEAALRDVESPATVHTAPLRQACTLAETRQAFRIRRGAVIIERPDPQFALTTGEHGDTIVSLEDAPDVPCAHLIVSELMILANAALARWASERGVAMLHRTQNVAVPKEYVGIWHTPQDVARVVRALAPACLETSPRPHAGLGEEMYAPTTSPLRRYPDLINEAQILHVLRHGTARWSKGELDAMLPLLNMRLDAAAVVQRQRPRYWKLLYIRQQGDRRWWPAVITDENDAFVSVSLPREQLFLRARHALFGDRIQPGQEIEVRLHKVYPLQNDVQIAETREPA